MKRIALTLAVLFSLISFSSFANEDENVTPAVLKSFNSSFRKATQVAWSVSSGLYKANFAMDGQYVAAFYDANGKMIALTRNVSTVQLPLPLQTALKSEAEGYWISDLFEISNEEGTKYYVTLENADTRLVLQASSNDVWSFYQKSRK